MACPRLLEPVDDAHLAGCPECQAVKASLAGFDAPAGDLSALRGAALAELARSPRARPWWVEALGFAGAAALAVLVATLALSPSAAQHRSELLHEVGAAAWCVLVFLGAVLALAPGGRTARVVFVGVFAVAAGLSLAIASGVDASGSGTFCAFFESVVALLPLAVALGLLTGFAADPLRAAVGGLSAGGAGLLAIHLHCANGTLAHQALAHLGPAVVVAVVAVLIRRSLPSRSHAP